MAALNDFYSTNRSLPNNGGMYNSVAPKTSGASTQPIFSTTTPKVDIPNGFVNPTTGNLYTAQEIVNNVAKKIPVKKPQVPEYAGDTITKPDKTVTDMTKTARTLTNTRNDIATGAEDPYKVGSQSGIAYSPAELAAIEKAYAGIYDPVLNDVFAKIKDKQAKDEEQAKKDDRVFQTNENIRQWRATTGSKSTETGDKFTQSQINSGASSAGLGIKAFTDLDNDIKNFFINTPEELNTETNKKVPMSESFANLVKGVKSGKLTFKEAADEIEASNLPEVVKHYYLDQMPEESTTPEEKQGYFSRLWSAIRGK